MGRIRSELTGRGYARLCLLAGVFAAAAGAMCGCAATAQDTLSDEPGVPVMVTTTSGEAFRAELVEMEEGALILERSRIRDEHLEVVDAGGRKIVYIDGVPTGTALSVREVDVLVRERIEFFRIDDVSVISRAYFGWGTAIAAVMAYFLVKLLDEV